MGRKGGKPDLQVIADQDDWEELLQERVGSSPCISSCTQGRLTLVEVYTEWAGPCQPMAAVLARIKVLLETKLACRNMG